jgi:hypothetical protein
MLESNSTTIQIQKSTKKLLDALKEAYQLKTYDAVVNKLIQKKNKFNFDAFADENPKVSMKEILKGLRDKHDRL